MNDTLRFPVADKGLVNCFRFDKVTWLSFKANGYSDSYESKIVESKEDNKTDNSTDDKGIMASNMTANFTPPKDG